MPQSNEHDNPLVANKYACTCCRVLTICLLGAIVYGCASTWGVKLNLGPAGIGLDLIADVDDGALIDPYADTHNHEPDPSIDFGVFAEPVLFDHTYTGPKRFCERFAVRGCYTNASVHVTVDANAGFTVVQSFNDNPLVAFDAGALFAAPFMFGSSGGKASTWQSATVDCNGFYVACMLIDGPGDVTLSLSLSP